MPQFPLLDRQRSYFCLSSTNGGHCVWPLCSNTACVGFFFAGITSATVLGGEQDGLLGEYSVYTWQSRRPVTFCSVTGDAELETRNL